jgi:DNA-binding transcriptional ArsR family regulator
MRRAEVRSSGHGTLARRIVNRMVYYSTLDRTFSALSDPTRRAMLERLSLGPATASELAAQARISLPGALKHVRILEEADLVTSEKRGRTRECRLGPAQLEDATAWIERHRSLWERRLDRLEAVIDKTKGGSR